MKKNPDFGAFNYEPSLKQNILPFQELNSVHEDQQAILKILWPEDGSTMRRGFRLLSDQLTCCYSLPFLKKLLSTCFLNSIIRHQLSLLGTLFETATAAAINP